MRKVKSQEQKMPDEERRLSNGIMNVTGTGGGSRWALG